MSLSRMHAAVLVAALGALALAPPLLAQTGSVSGTTRHAQTGEPIQAAQVVVDGLNMGTLSQNDGRFTIADVPVGEQVIEVRVIGFGTVRETVMVQANEETSLSLTLSPEVVPLSEMVVTGTIGATARAKLPFTVDQIGGMDLQVVTVNAASAIQGKVAGATVVQGSGRPGAAPSILLRGATSINASGRSQEPLYIVDGVILGSSVVDVDGMDIDQIEVVKGAAAASLYGSRAANGVVLITTRRGSQYTDGQVRYTARSRVGTSDLPGSFDLLESHFWELNADGTRFIDSDGTECDFVECSGNIRLAGQTAGGGSRDEWNTFATNPWPGGVYDQVGRFFDGGGFQEHYVSASGRQGATNFLVSYSRSDDEGVMLGKDGFRRNNFRLNLDQVVRPDVHVAASAFYSRSIQDGTEGPLFDLTRMQAGVDLTQCEGNPGRSCLGDPENLILNANPTNIESENPLYDMLVRRSDDTRGRFLASTNVRYSPANWLDVDADVSYDRLDRETVGMLPKGYRTIDASPGVNDGTLSMTDRMNEALNGSITASFRYDLSDRIVNRTQLRYLYEQQDNKVNSTNGSRFGVVDVPRFNNTNSDFLSASSSETSVRADGYFIITNFDIHDRYIIDGLIRNDGSSLFGADERRQWYGRLAGAWRLAQEDWFDVAMIDELKLRYSYGTAGGRPNFSAQYETFSVSGGQIIPVALGNRDLKPEHSTEQEYGFDLVLNNRITLGVTRANTETRDQILQVPLPSYTGYVNQWQNVGTLESNTWEASLGAQLVETPNLSWSARILYDNTTSTITELNVPDFRYGVGGQGLGDVFFARLGEELGTFYGTTYARSCADLPTDMSCDGFAVNDDGWLVWVGDGGFEANAWGTDSDVTVRGSSVDWGTPFRGECDNPTTGGRTTTCKVGNTAPDYTVSLSSNLQWRGITLYGLLDAVQGIDVYNQPLQWALFRRNIGMMDQSDVPENDRKPIGYFDALYGVSGLAPSNAFVEDASFVKLREVSINYRFTADQLERLPILGGFNSLGFNVSGKNLKTWTDYRGYDPEVGAPGGSTGSAALARVDGYRYPNFRTWTFGVELNF